MKKILLVMFLSVLALSMVSAIGCELDTSLLNQDPINAVPGEYVDVVFQMQGVENPDCKTVTFQLVPEYPFSIDPNVETTKVIEAGTFNQNYNSQATIPFSLRVDPSALDKIYQIKVMYSTSKGGSELAYTEQFNISVENVRADFDIFVDDFVSPTKTITFSILNVGKNDVEALTVEIPKQAGVNVKGSNKAIIGTLDANQDTTFSYEALPQDGNIAMIVYYNDENGERRNVTKQVSYDSSYFTDRTRDAEKKSSPMTWVIIIIVILAVVYFIRKRMKKKAEHPNLHRR